MGTAPEQAAGRVRPGSGWRYAPGAGVGLYRCEPLQEAGALAVCSGRSGGASRAPYDSLNLGGSVGDGDGEVAVNRARLASALGLAGWERLATARQVHGVAVRRVSTPGPQGVDADALIASGSGSALAILVADCAPVYLFDPVRGAIGLCHAGWRGTVAGIAARTVAAMRQAFGTRAGDLLAAVGPSIGPCCYEVDEPVLGPLRAAAAWWADVVRPGRAGHAWLDVPGANARFLRDAGLAPERIAPAPLCTVCAPSTLYSHRRDGPRTGRMAAVLALP